MPQSLAVRYTTEGAATQVQVFRNNNGSFVAFGTAYTPTSFATTSTQLGKNNLAVQFGDKFYCSAGGEIRVYNPSTGNWDLDVVMTGVGGSDTSGIYIGRGPTGALRALVVGRGAGNLVYERHLDTPGGAWSAVASTGLGTYALGNGFDQGIVFNNTLFIGHQHIIFSLNFATLAGTAQTLGVGYPTPFAYTRAKGRLFALFNPAGSGNDWTNILEFIGGAFVLALTGATNGAMPRANVLAQPARATRWLGMHYDEASDSLIVHSWQQTATAGAINPGGSGWYTVQVPLTTLVEVDISTTVLPGGLKSPGGLSPALDARFAIEVDTDTNPLVPVTYIWVCRANGSWARYQWNGVASPLTALGTGGNRGLALSHNPNGGGQYFYDGSTTGAPAYHVEEVQARVALPGATRIFLRGVLFDETGGVPSVVDGTVGLYWGTTQQTADNLATITNATKVSGPGNAPGIAANKITNFTMDDTTIYSVDWQASTDGLANAVDHMLMPRVEA